MYITLLGFELLGTLLVRTASADMATVDVADLAVPLAPVENYMFPRGGIRYMDPLALWMAEVTRRSQVGVSHAALKCVSTGATRHYFEVTRRMASGDAFSPLAYSNRSCNAIAAQVSQLLKVRGGAEAYFGTRCSDLLNGISRRVKRGRPVLVCGGRIREASTPSTLYGEESGFNYCYSLLISDSPRDDSCDWRIVNREESKTIPTEDYRRADSYASSFTLREMDPLGSLVVGLTLGIHLGHKVVSINRDGDSAGYAIRQ